MVSAFKAAATPIARAFAIHLPTLVLVIFTARAISAILYPEW
jgi:hypothetical protein